MRNSDDSRMSFEEGQNKDKYSGDLQRVYQALFDTPQTMKEVDVSIGVMRESICWYCRTLRKENKIFKVRKRACNVTNYPKAWELTTDPEKANIEHDFVQTKMFD